MSEDKREPRLSAPARLVRQFDPDLFHAALFAPEPARERLMVLYALDVELSRAAETPSEPLIARMRLQFWREVLEGAPRQHEVAEPVHRLLAAHALPGVDLAALVAARELELDGAMDEARFTAWLDGRFGALSRLATRLLVGEAAPAQRAASAAGQAIGLAFALRTAPAMAAAGGPTRLPGLSGADLAALARGRTTEAARGLAQRLAERGLGLVAAARAERGAVPRAAVPAFLPLWRAERVLGRARAPAVDLVRDLDRPGDAGTRGLSLAWRALSGRW